MRNYNIGSPKILVVAVGFETVGRRSLERLFGTLVVVVLQSHRECALLTG